MRNHPDFINENLKDSNCLPQGYKLDIIRSVKNYEDISMNEWVKKMLDL